MSFRKVASIGLLAALMLGGVWLLSRSAGVGPETAQRDALVRQMAAPAGARDSAGAAGDMAYEPITPVVVNMRDVPEGVYTPNNTYDLWRNGLIDLDENESRVSQAAMDALRAEALDMPAQEIAGPSGSNDFQAAGVSFTSLDASECCGGGTSVPPDPEMAVGATHIIATVNVSFEIYNKSGTSVYGPVTFDSFFSGVPGCVSTFDPNAVYDDSTGRYIIGVDGDGTHYCIAVSQTGNPTGAWNLYSFQTSTSALGNPFFDYPHIGVGIDAIYMGANMFNGIAGFEGRVWAMNKAAMYAGSPMAPVTRSLGDFGGTPQPVNFQGSGQGTFPTSGPHYIVTDPYDGDNVTVWTWANALSGTTSPAVAATLNMQTASGVTSGAPGTAPQLGSSALLEANDWRMRSAEYRNGNVWVSDSISCNPGGGTVNCVRWAQISLAGTPAILQAGVLASNGEHRLFGDLSTNSCEDMLIGYTKTSSSMYPAVFVNGRSDGDPNGTVQTEVLVKAGETAYTSFDGSPYRWGDYTSMRIDPDGQTFWYLGEYSKSGVAAAANWGTYIGSFTFPGCVPFEVTDFLYLPMVNRN